MLDDLSAESLEEQLRKAIAAVIEMAPDFADAMRDLASATASLAEAQQRVLARLGQVKDFRDAIQGEEAEKLLEQLAGNVDKDPDPTA